MVAALMSDRLSAWLKNGGTVMTASVMGCSVTMEMFNITTIKTRAGDPLHVSKGSSVWALSQKKHKLTKTIDLGHKLGFCTLLENIPKLTTQK